MQHSDPMSDPIETAIFEKLSAIDPKGTNGKSIEPAEVAKDLQPSSGNGCCPRCAAWR